MVAEWWNPCQCEAVMRFDEDRYASRDSQHTRHTSHLGNTVIYARSPSTCNKMADHYQIYVFHIVGNIVGRNSQMLLVEDLATSM